MPKLVLASSSKYRRILLARLGHPFDVACPDVDETPRPGETAEQLVLRLATAKAQAVAETQREAVVIGSDQVAVVDATILGKPGDRDRAIAQLTRLSGHRVRFLTGICVVSETGPLIDMDETIVSFRQLTAREITTYVDREQPFDCAGSFKSEALGIALFDGIESTDPTALVGLPLVRLCRLLRDVGLDPLA